MSKIIVDKTHNSSSNLSLVSTNRYLDTVIKLLRKLKIQSKTIFVGSIAVHF